jgi:DNA-binding protein H-NS
MISNLASARALIQADLDHARSVLALWTDQVSELEKALEQINSVDNSRTALRGASQAQKGSVPGLTAGNGADGKARRGRKPKHATAAQPDGKGKRQRAATSASTSAESKTAEESPRMARRPPRGTTTPMEKKRAVPGTAKYRDPNSSKTWTGHGRRPGWMVGAPEQYAIDDQAGPQGAPAGKNSGADTAAMVDATA